MNEFLYVLSLLQRYVFPPLIGGAIGVFTNWLAVKMLFHPYKAVCIGKFRLPFTPGIIPKRKENLAHAVGKAVAEELLTEKELVKVVSAPEIKEGFLATIKKFLYKGKTVKELTEGTDFPDALSDAVSEKIVHAALLADIDAVIASCGGNAVKSKINNPLLSVFLTDRFIASVSKEIAVSIKNYLSENGRAIVSPLIGAELEKVSDKKIGEVLSDFGLTEEKLELMLSGAYDRFTEEGMQKLYASANVAAVVEEKIDSMDVKDIARLTYKVINKEMNAVVLLGGLLGAIIGVINIFV